MYAYVVCLCVCVRVCVLIKRKMGAEYEKHKPLKLVQTVPFFRLLLLKKKACPGWWVQPRKRKRQSKRSGHFRSRLHCAFPCNLFLPFAGRDCPDSFRIKWELSHTAALVLQANSKNGDPLRMDGVLLPVCPGGGSKPSSIPMDREKGSEFDAAFRKTFPTHFKWLNEK